VKAATEDYPDGPLVFCKRIVIRGLQGITVNSPRLLTIRLAVDESRTHPEGFSVTSAIRAESAPGKIVPTSTLGFVVYEL
jgi:hypothetical protein